MTAKKLMAELRDVSRAAHDRLEALPYAQALSRHELPLESYVGHLRTMAVIHSVLEHELPVETDIRIESVWDDSMRRLPSLQRDLDRFAPTNTRDIPAAHAVANRIADRLIERSVESPLSMLGYLYVVEGSTLGGRVLSQWVRETFDLCGRSGLSYLQPYGEHPSEHWESFGAKMNALRLDPLDRAAIVDAALEAFRLFEQLIKTLYPIDNGDLAFLVGSLNPEAGTHPIPQDPREIEAARRAGARCLEEYPYFVVRYGERGQRFTDSDGAWLITLVRYEQARIDRQVAWLGGVLATRGMPRNLLERHLELLHEELQRLPLKDQAPYDKLLTASRQLANGRRVLIEDDVLLGIVGRFDNSVRDDQTPLKSGAGSILVNAVVDERSGLTGSLDSVQSWFSDPTRFSTEWVAAVDRCIAEAQRALSNRE